MLDSELKEQLYTIFSPLEAEYLFDISVSPEHGSRAELLELLEDVSSCSEKISCRVGEGEGLSFVLMKNGKMTGIKFRAVPNGHRVFFFIAGDIEFGRKREKFSG